MCVENDSDGEHVGNVVFVLNKETTAKREFPDGNCVEVEID
mgnify:CR=1 FL=1